MNVVPTSADRSPEPAYRPSAPLGIVLALMPCFVTTAVPASARHSYLGSATQQDSAAELHRKGLDAFFQTEDFPAAEALFREVLEHPGCAEDLRPQAHFYLVAALARQSLDEQALEESRRWLEKYPEDGSAAMMSFYQGCFLRNLGRPEEARRVWKQLRADHPGTTAADAARSYLEAMPSALRSGASRPPSRLKGVLPAGPTSSGAYLVVRVGLEPEQPLGRAFRKVADEMASFHEAGTLDFDGRDFDGLAGELARLGPRHVVFVLAPETLDITLHRRILLLSTRLDDDVFPDFEFGYFTAKTGEQLEDLWQRTRVALRNEEHGRRWISTAVSNVSMVVPGSIPAAARAAGFEGERIYWSVVESDPDVLSFVDEHLPELEKADVIEMTGNGDPQGIWLFSDRRNLDPSRHWDYEPDCVGRHPEEMPRILASRFAALHLASPIVWSGTCHSAATRRVFVEGDIVSTFGRTQGVTVHRLAPENSLCLSWIEAGALALLAPIAANHGMSVSMEEDFALTHGADLGRTLKSTYDDVVLAAEGNLLLELPEEGREPSGFREDVMQGGGSNRLLIGDPALSPFPRVERPGESVRVTNRREGGFDVVVEWDAGWHSRAWDIFGRDSDADWRVETQVDLEGLAPEDVRLEFQATLSATDLQGTSLPYALRHCEPEEFHGQRILHLQANAPRAAVQDEGARCVFSVTYR